MNQYSQNQFLTVKEVADRLRISKSYAYELTRREDFPCVRLGRVVRIPVDALDDWVSSQTRNS